MKKLALLLVITLCFAMTSCSKKPKSAAEPTTAPKVGAASLEPSAQPGDASTPATSSAPKAPVSENAEFNAAKDKFDTAYAKVVSDLKAFSSKDDDMLKVVPKVLDYFKKNAKSSLKDMDSSIKKMESIAKTDTEKAEIESSRSAYKILETLKNTDSNIDNLKDEDQMQIIGYIISLVYSDEMSTVKAQ